MATSKIPELGGKPGAATLTMVRGDQWRRPMTLSQGDVAVDLTGATLEAVLLATLGDTVPVATPDLVVVDAVTGSCVIDITEAMSALLVDQGAPYWLVIRMTDSLDQLRTLAQIRVEALP